MADVDIKNDYDEIEIEDVCCDKFFSFCSCVAQSTVCLLCSCCGCVIFINGLVFLILWITGSWIFDNNSYDEFTNYGFYNRFLKSD